MKKLIVTIDTEEDNWGEYSQYNYNVSNIEQLNYLQDIFNFFGFKPTYLVNYPVLKNDSSAKIMHDLYIDGKCEIGMHCHPWNTPPIQDKTNCMKYSMLCNLNYEIQYNKLKTIYDIIFKNYSIKPKSFRAGRFGFGLNTAKALEKLHITHDTSVTPYTNWKVNTGPDFSDFDLSTFRFDSKTGWYPQSKGSLLEVPVTIGFLQKNFDVCNKILKYLEVSVLKKIKVIGFLNKANLLNKAWLSPELSDAETMIKLTKRVFENGYPYLNMMFHSTSLRHGLSPFVKSKQDEVIFFNRIKTFLQYIKNMNYESATLEEIL
jgi:hypothetical protein